MFEQLQSVDSEAMRSQLEVRGDPSSMHSMSWFVNVALATCIPSASNSMTVL